MQKPTTPPDIGNADRSGGVLGTSILALASVVIAIGLRFYTRIKLVKKVGWDDWCIVFAGFGHCVGMGLITTQIAYGFGRPAYYLTDHQFQEFTKYAYGEWLQTFATLTFTKLSICLLLLRIAISKAFTRPLWVAIFVLIVSNIVLSILWILQCRPHLDKAWNNKLPGKCFSKGQLERIVFSQAIISIVSDYFLSMFPILIIRKVQISFRSKVGLCLLMGLGVITGSLSVVRTVLNWQNFTEDPTWLVIPNWYWRTWEVLFGVWAACIPTLRPLYKKLVDDYQRWSTKGKASNPPTQEQDVLRPAKSKPTQRTATKNTGTLTGETNANFLPIQVYKGEGLFEEKEGDGTATHIEFPSATHMYGDTDMTRPIPSKRWDTEERLVGK